MTERPMDASDPLCNPDDPDVRFYQNNKYHFRPILVIQLPDGGYAVGSGLGDRRLLALFRDINNAAESGELGPSAEEQLLSEVRDHATTRIIASPRAYQTEPAPKKLDLSGLDLSDLDLDI